MSFKTSTGERLSKANIRYHSIQEWRKMHESNLSVYVGVANVEISQKIERYNELSATVQAHLDMMVETGELNKDKYGYYSINNEV